ncbi:hypothetical protein EWM64_g7913 [Hericium alpestre]|uniref:HAT C-terminal dimerisation domain-containing protein n=1 Tax=Hericium alpestre TaxID=135208 RepID=A0A4Y9ZQJ3_9AGAM|nr:hypothetical protein EWM64_g7913 [Hericium alpestre]
MIQELEHLLPEFPGETNHTRCFAHIVNLVAKSLLKQFDTKKGGAGADSGAEAELDALAEDIDIEDMQTRLENTAVAAEGDEVIDEEEGWVNEVAELTADEKKELEKSILPVRLVLVKLRKVSYKIVHSTTKLLPAWKKTLSDLKMNERVMPRDVSTRWNSTYDMLDFALEYKRALRAVVGDMALGLDAYELSVHEWNIAQQLRDVLNILKDAMLFFSRGTPNLATVIPAMDHIDSSFTTDALAAKYSPAIRASLNIAKCTLNHYYTMTDLSEVYRIAMVLHPRHKLAYFKAARWEQDWIDTARNVVREEFDRSYASREVEDDTEDENNSAEVEDSAQKPTHTNLFDNLPTVGALNTEDGRDELDRYLSTDPEPVQDAIAWWSHPKHRSEDSDVLKVAALGDVLDGDPAEEFLMEEGWDAIKK